MIKKTDVIKYLFYLVALSIFTYYEYDLYLKYSYQKKIRDGIKKEKTDEIKRSFLLRKEDFYKDTEYKKEFEKLKLREVKEKKLLEEGGEEKWMA